MIISVFVEDLSDELDANNKPTPPCILIRTVDGVDDKAVEWATKESEELGNGWLFQHDDLDEGGAMRMVREIRR